MVANENPLNGDDLTLIQKYVSLGDREAILLLISKHQRMVFATCRRYFRCEADAEDATQEVFLTFMVNAGSIKSNVGGWLSRCAMNTAASMVRTRQAQLRREYEKARQVDTSGENEAVQWSEWLSRLPEALDQLDPTDHGLVFQNCAVGNTQKEIASSLGISQQAVAKRIGKAITQVRRALLSRNGVAGLIGVVLLLAKRVTSAAIPHGLRVSLASPAASGSALGTAGTLKLGAAAVVVITAAVVTYECSENTSAATISPAVPEVTAVSYMPAHGIVKPINSGFPVQSKSSGLSLSTAYAPFQIGSMPLNTRPSVPSTGSLVLLNYQFTSQSTGSANWHILQTSSNAHSTMTSGQLIFTSTISVMPAGKKIYILPTKAKLGTISLPNSDGGSTNDQAAAAEPNDIVIADQASSADVSTIQSPLPDSVVASTADASRNQQGTFFSGSNYASPRQLATVGQQWRFQNSNQDVIESVPTTASINLDSVPVRPRALRISPPRAPANDGNSASDAGTSFTREPYSFTTEAAGSSGQWATFRNTPSITSPTRAPLDNGITRTPDQTLVSAGATLSTEDEIDGRLINQGVVAAGEETLYLNGLVSGRGSYLGRVVFTGGFSPGNSPAAVHVDDAVLDSTNTLTMELGGLTPGSEYDQLIVGDNLTLGGNLDVPLIDGFVPRMGDSFQLFDGNLNGHFTNITLPSLAGGLSWDTSRLNTRGSVAVAVPEPASLILLLPAGVFALLRRRQRNEHQLKSYCQRQADSIFIGCWWLRRVVPD